MWLPSIRQVTLLSGHLFTGDGLKEIVFGAVAGMVFSAFIIHLHHTRLDPPPVSLEMECQVVHYEADTDRSIRLCMNDLERCYESWAGISCVPRGR